MESKKTIDRAAINAAVYGVMEHVCDRCIYLHSDIPESEAEAHCEKCPVEERVQELVAVVENEVALTLATVMADAIRAIGAGGENND